MSDTESRNPFTSRGFIFGAIIFGALVLAAILLAVTSLGGGGGQNTPAATATPTTSSTPNIDADAASVCDLPGYEETNTLTSPPEAEWNITGTVAVPESPLVGPGVVDDDGFRTCFAHTAAGALFSAVSYVAMSSDAQTAARVTELVAPGPGRDIAIASADPNRPVSSSRLQLVGYNITSYTADNAVIDLAWRVTSTAGEGLVSYPMAMTWVEGDWKMELTDNGQQRFSTTQLQSLGGYTPWAGV
ncbi:hypothetical protein [Rathayibacter sp. VKM Ac-2754]|uniref:hypothetical protein n=1 Tax=Rathayibacter sp. VKM Ac-2754 TaxID=2609251 RepID=UPI00135755D5|nr:hypothetical protein [Rathayibacter sp. VKM Ac-2754]MWV60843.1 hypothetical protein [Rathayibacter sp. VKM Ac-2754]